MTATTNQQLIITYLDSLEYPLEKIGGKAASLIELQKAKASVPEFAIVTTNAYYEIINNGIDLTSEIEQLDRIYQMDELFRKASEIRRKILEAPVPDHIKDAILKAGREISKGFTYQLAVRSSATLEDMPDASFAGQHESYLGIKSERELLEAYRKCIASTFSNRAVEYRKDLGLSHLKSGMAVIIQRLVDARAAGVMFTLNPVNGDRSVVAIESSWGLGEAVVKGEVNPDRFFVNKITKELVKREISPNKNIVYERTDEGVVVRENTRENASKPSIGDEEAIRLAEIGIEIERYFGNPQDIEWVIEGPLGEGEIYVVQSRPETVWSRKETKNEYKPILDRMVDSFFTAFDKLGTSSRM